MKLFRENLLFQFSVVSFAITAAIGTVISITLTTGLSNHLDLMDAFLVSGHHMLTDDIDNLRWTILAMIAGGFLILYGGLVSIVWTGWKTIVKQRTQLETFSTDLEDQLLQRDQEMELVDELARMVTSTLNIDEVYEKFAQEVKGLVDFDRIVINLIDHQAETYTLKYMSGLVRSDRPVGTTNPLGGSQTAHVVKSCQTLVREDIPEDITFETDLAQARTGIRSNVMVPLLSKGRVIGTLSLRSLKAKAYGSRAQAILERLASQVAPAVENAELHRQLQVSVDEMDLVDEVARIVTSTLNIDEVYEKFALETKKLVDFDRMAITLIDELSGTGTLKYLFGQPLEGRELGIVSPLASMPHDSVISSGQTSIRDDISDDTRYPTEKKFKNLGLLASIQVPLEANGRTIAIMTLRSTQIGTYGPREQAVLERLAMQIAPAVENAELYERRIQVEEEIRGSEERYKELYDNAPVAYCSVGIEGTIQRCNSLFLDIFGYTAWEIDKLPVSQIHSDTTEQQKLAQEVFSAFKSGDTIRDQRLQMKRKDGSLFWASLTVTPCRNESGEVVESRSVVVDITERMAAEEQLRKLSRAVEQSPSAVVITDQEGVIEYINPKFTQTTGYTLDEAVGNTSSLLRSSQTPLETYQELWGAIKSGDEWHGEFLNRKKNGELYWSQQHISPIRDTDGTITHFVALEEDITERKRLEAQLQQSQKMETVGQLAGGVAHDFNNILTAIMGYSQMVLLKSRSGKNVESYIDEVLKATERASNLTSQLLAFSRQQVIEPTVVNMSDLILDIDKMIRRLIGEDIELVTLPAAGLHSVKVDRGQMEQVLMNLAVNGRDAMSHGGKLTIETANLSLNEIQASRYADVSPGRYVMLRVTDVGTGMTKEVKEHIFEPFYTTKDMGKGTGLGLSTCYGIIAQSGGHIVVDSELGLGTSFKILLPVIDAVPDVIRQSTPTLDVPHGTETVLLAEDEPMVRSMVVQVLRDYGYQVLEAGNGDEALRIAEKHTGKIDLLITDVVMPGVRGPELVLQLGAKIRDMKVLFTSGYTDGGLLEPNSMPFAADFLQKPYMPATLAAKVREVLER